LNEQLVELVWKVLSGIPIDIFDEDTHEVWEGAVWELALPRNEGDYSGSREIGAANLVSAYNLLHLKLIAASNSHQTLEQFKQILTLLETRRLIRRRPDRVRQTFKVV
jgi:hypothetical protein